MARGGRRGSSRLITLSSPAAAQASKNEKIHSTAIKETHQEEILGIKSNGTVPQLEVPSNTLIIDGKKIAKIEKEDVETRIEYWQNAIICSGQTLPMKSCKDLSDAFREPMRLIKSYRKGVFLIRFGNIQDILAVEKRGIYYFDAKFLLVKGWNSQMDLQTENIKSLPIWPQQNREHLGNSFDTKDKTMIKYARLLIDISLDGSFLDHIEFFNEEGVLKVMPEVRTSEHLMQTTEQQSTSSLEDFTQVTKRNTAKQPQLTANQSTYELGNPF
ncbi:LOW QUALITY PROTEIN: hypothetical protein Cgig2_019934 [Carnegiea gigantea]|uniref:DUF4283 domain-containing protein n=1 Tax=Carnegiea gigantea TaxID=171969 RepID=A0A9Q1JIC7_9CARY|nr:LOW QUALITY PROTEIN: hypothetical protein Cgig2_019934 [Carnegiea gigantea]